jgi:predicted methyltransferase
MIRGTLIPLFAVLLTAPAEAATDTAAPAAISAALADPLRPADQVARDAMRKPADVIAFAGLKPGDRVGDFMPASGYFTRIFSRVVGQKGHVYAYVPSEEIRNCSPGETAGGLALAHDPNYPNVNVSVGPVNSYAAPEALDMIWTAQNYHDLYDPFMGPADLVKFDAAAFRALKHGGVFLVIDHVAEAGSGTRDTNTLHRIDPAIIERDVEGAGFALIAESDLLRNPADTHMLRVFDPQIRGKTDQVVLKFVKP